MIHDFHTHTFLSDGVLTPIELIRRAEVAGYAVIGIADHAGAGTLERVIRENLADARLAAQHWRIRPLVGVELTHVPPESIPELARQARAVGAQYVAVHGETPVEPTCPGTNLVAVQCSDVDYLCHPGLITLEEAKLAAATGVFLEITARSGHSYANGHVAQVALAAGARLLMGSDAHAPGDLLSEALVEKVLRGAGLDSEHVAVVRGPNVDAFLRRSGEESRLGLAKS
jgi:histidinol phosphatase-like PHP family hydrolase